jgi:hypothetical protein
MPLIPEGDEQYLKDKQFDYQLMQAGPEIHLILRGWPFPEAYTVRTADVLVRIPAGYPAGRPSANKWKIKADVFGNVGHVITNGGTASTICEHSSPRWPSK